MGLNLFSLLDGYNEHMKQVLKGGVRRVRIQISCKSPNLPEHLSVSAARLYLHVIQSYRCLASGLPRYTVWG